MKEPKEQIAAITYPKGETCRSAFVQHHIAAEKAKGRIVVLRGNHATVHKP